jgi:hypothetical protein
LLVNTVVAERWAGGSVRYAFAISRTKAGQPIVSPVSSFSVTIGVVNR